MAEDDQGNLWMGCSRGVFRVSRADFDHVAHGRKRTVTSTSYGLEDGLKSTVMASGFVPTIRCMKDGRVWVATTDGVSVVDPKAVSTNTIPPPVHIEEARIDGVAMNTSQAAEAPPGSGDLTFRYTGLSFIDPQRMRFQVRLDPYDRDWLDVQNLRIKQYTNIPPGRYTFRVKAANSDGVWNESGARFELHLAPHFYQTWWFTGLCVIGVALATYGAYRWRIRLHEQRERELEVRVDQALAQVKTLSGMLPICASCKKIRDDSGYWNQMETYIHEHSGVDFSHSVCPECMEKLYPDYAASQRVGQ